MLKEMVTSKMLASFQGMITGNSSPKTAAQWVAWVKSHKKVLYAIVTDGKGAVVSPTPAYLTAMMDGTMIETLVAIFSDSAKVGDVNSYIGWFNTQMKPYLEKTWKSLFGIDYPPGMKQLLDSTFIQEIVDKVTEWAKASTKPTYADVKAWCVGRESIRREKESEEK